MAGREERKGKKKHVKPWQEERQGYRKQRKSLRRYAKMLMTRDLIEFKQGSMGEPENGKNVKSNSSKIKFKIK